MLVEALEQTLNVPSFLQEEHIEQWKRLVKHLKSKTANKEWCIEILSSLQTHAS